MGLLLWFEARDGSHASFYRIGYFGLEVALLVGKYDECDGYLPRERFSPMAHFTRTGRQI
jgi:hypothetical protein